MGLLRAVPILGVAVWRTLAGQQLPADSGRFRLTPLVAPAYSPEMRFLVASGFLASWKNGAQWLELQRSTLSSVVSISTTGAVNAAATLTAFAAHDRFRITADLSYKNLPDNYWGVGFASGLQLAEGDSTTRYRRKWFKFNPEALCRVADHLFVGGAFEFARTDASDVSPAMRADASYRSAGGLVRSVGLGLATEYDSRDVAINPWHGLYLGLSTMFYGPYLGGDHTYQTYLVDYRQYRPLGRPGRTLAWQVKAQIGAHDVPWPELSLLGTGSDLRGYTEGRFRDRSTLLGVVEYRYTFLRRSGQLSRHGFVMWVGGGALGRDPAHLVGVLPNAGAGYRFEIQPRASVRLDAGVGRKSSGVYFSFGEAF